MMFFFFFSSRRRHTRCGRDWSSDVCSSDLTGAIRKLIAFEVERARAHYALAAPGIPMLAPVSQPCIRTAYRLYGGILDEVVRAGYDVFSRRAAVPNKRRLAVAAASMLTPPGRPVPLPASGASRRRYVIGRPDRG